MPVHHGYDAVGYYYQSGKSEKNIIILQEIPGQKI